ncbi:MAG: ATP-binding protein [Dissulfurimicrobium sp.]|uniref:ATP-binding protein n=1 Tax=Dissulfurimicrobium sp. TaxID=2022436 RepID=UPI003D0F7894
MKTLRKIIEIDEALCNGCGKCVPSCAEGAIQIIDGKARLVAERYCDGLGACLGECPQGALRIVERVADDFDEEAAHRHLSGPMPAETKGAIQGAALGCGCPSTLVQEFGPQKDACARANQPVNFGSLRSALTHWPVQIRLVPPAAPFLKGADLLVAADCTAFSYPAFHMDLLPGKVLLIGCPKFDNAHEYVERFIEIFKKAQIKSLTTVIMEVPCCSSMLGILNKAMEGAGVSIPLKKIVVSARGELLD